MSRDCFYVVLGAVMMGSLPVFVRNLHYSSVEIAFFRLSLGFLFLSLFLCLMREKPELRNWKLIFAITVINTATIVLYISSIQLTKAATAALLLYMAPVYVIPLSKLVGEKINTKQLFALPLGLAGLWLMISPDRFSAGDVFGLFSGVCYAVYFLLMKKARQEMDSLHITFAYLALSSLMLLPFATPKIAIPQLPWLLGLGLVPTALAFTIFNHGIKGCGAARSSISALVEPVAAGTFGYFLLGECLSFQQTLGGLLILTAVLIAVSV